MDNVNEIKIVFLGASGVGKSSILQRFSSGNFSAEIQTTLGASFITKKMVIKNKTVKFQIWDTAGQEKYHAISQMYYRDAGAAIIVFDVTNRKSFEDMRNWTDEVREKVICIVGNKIDLLQGMDEVLDDMSDSFSKPVDLEKAKQYAEDVGAIFLTTTAKFGKGIQEVFTTIGEKASVKNAKTVKEPIILRDDDEKPVKIEAKRSCC